ncbi:type II toxin-antitoxin system Phd/YefM family antitoxin [Acidithiobacillus sulfuriphilus]|uniref:type II toxin-antitoxin system Phd/YefM family antitoxin n=1 Tax=Acidithiobacillus sulfuriphilus TaxID=1867749 RepID=UPI003F60CDB1
MRTVTAADANRQFSSVLREVSQGETFTVVSRGRPVATIAPASADHAQRSAAKARLLVRLRAQGRTGARDWSRNELYE